jgi:hypothetical protein
LDHIYSEYRKSRALIWTGIGASIVFAALFWVIQRIENPDESILVTVLYRAHDNTYFNVIARMLRHHLAESFYLDSAGTGQLPYPIMGILPYAFFHSLFGGWGFLAGDVFASVLRFFAFWYAVGPLARNSRERVLMTLAITFLTCEYVQGDYIKHWFFEGLWGIRIPRPFLTVSYFLISFGVLVRLREILRNNGSPREIALYGVPLALVASADPHFFLILGITTALLLIYWFGTSQVPIRSVLLYVLFSGICVGLVMIHITGLPPDVQLRVGNVPVFDHIIAVEIPLLEQMILFVLSALGCALLARFRARDERAISLLLVATIIFGVTFVASPLVSAIRGVSLQEYQFTFRRMEMGGFLVALWLLYGVRILFAKRPMTLAITYSCVALVTYSICVYRYYGFASEFAQNEAGIGSGPFGKAETNWRKPAGEVLKYVEEHYGKDKVVIGTLDFPLMLLLTMRPNVYLFVAPVYQTSATDDEVEERFMELCALIGPSHEFMKIYLQSNAAHDAYISFWKYQFNRMNTFAPLGTYKPDDLNTLLVRRDAGSTLIPPYIADQLLQKYDQVRNRITLSPSAGARFKLPDLIILNRGEAFDALTPHGYQKVAENATFRLFERR